VSAQILLCPCHEQQGVIRGVAVCLRIVDENWHVVTAYAGPKYSMTSEDSQHALGAFSGRDPYASFRSVSKQRCFLPLSSGASAIERCQSVRMRDWQLSACCYFTQPKSKWPVACVQPFILVLHNWPARQDLAPSDAAVYFAMQSS
jgi:hypothetical protein